MPCGAGLCVRRSVARRYLHLHECGKRSFQFDRTGGSLLSGGDNDLAGCCVRHRSWVGLIASLKLTHLISPERLTVDYLVRLAEGVHYSSILLDSEHGIRTGPANGIGPYGGFPANHAVEPTSPSDLASRLARSRSRTANSSLKLILL